MISYVLASGIVLFLLIVGLVVSIGAAVWWAIYAEKQKGIGIIIFLTISGVCLVLWLSGVTTYVVEPNKELLLVDKTKSDNGKPFVTEYKNPGPVGVPLPWTFDTYTYPTNGKYHYTPVVEASVNGGGICLKLTINYVLDARNINWKNQYILRNGDEAKITGAWTTELSDLIKTSVSKYYINDFNLNRDKVVASIADGTKDWFTKNGIQSGITDKDKSSVSLVNWDFCNPDVGKTYDEASSGQVEIQLAEIQLQVAQKNREVELYRAETQKQVAETVATLQRHACDLLGISSAAQCVQYLQILWLNGVQNANIVVSTGNGQGLDLSIPLATPATPYPTPTSVPQ